MNYRRVYMKIILNAKYEQSIGKRPLNKYRAFTTNNNIYEFHHILPKSLFPLWKKRKSNIVPLTIREHYFVHKLLTKIYPSPEMTLTLNMFTTCSKSKYLNIPYSEIERNRAEMVKVCQMKIKEYYSKEENRILARERSLKVFSENKWIGELITERNIETWKNPEVREKRVNGLRSKIAVKVKELNTGLIFNSMEEAAKWAGLKKTSGISAAARGQRKYAGKTPSGLPARWEVVQESQRNLNYKKSSKNT